MWRLFSKSPELRTKLQEVNMTSFFNNLCTSVQSFLVGFKNDWYGGLRQPTELPDCRCFRAQRPQKVKPSKIPVFSVLLLALLGYCFEFCQPGRSKKYRCLCVCAKTVFAISTPVSFLCSFSCSHLVAEGRQGGRPLRQRSVWYVLWKHCTVHRYHLLAGIFCRTICFAAENGWFLSKA